MRAVNIRNLHGHIAQEPGVQIINGTLCPGDDLPREEVLAYSLPYHRKVFETIRRRQPEAAQRAMPQMMLDSRANMTGKRRIRKPL